MRKRLPLPGDAFESDPEKTYSDTKGKLHEMSEKSLENPENPQDGSLIKANKSTTEPLVSKTKYIFKSGNREALSVIDQNIARNEVHRPLTEYSCRINKRPVSVHKQFTKETMVTGINTKGKQDKDYLENSMLTIEKSFTTFVENNSIDEFEISERECCLEIIQKFDIERSLVRRIDTISELYQVVENAGILTKEILEDIVRYFPGFCGIRFTKSFGDFSGEKIHVLKKPIERQRMLSIMKFLYSRHSELENVKFLDFTEVDIDDNMIRYVIRLANLEALGLSSTFVSNKGIRYLERHSAFRDKLKILKLCYLNDQVDDTVVGSLSNFSMLEDLDLWSTNISLRGVISLISIDGEDMGLKRLKNLRVPQHVFQEIARRRNIFKNIRERHLHPDSQFIEDNQMVQCLSHERLLDQLTILKDYYDNIVCLNDPSLSREDLLKMLEKALYYRKKEEKVWSML